MKGGFDLAKLEFKQVALRARVCTFQCRFDAGPFLRSAAHRMYEVQSFAS